MKSFLQITLLTGIIVSGFILPVNAQSAVISALKERVNQLKQKPDYQQDTAYINALNQLAFFYADSYPDSAIALLAGHAERYHSLGFRQKEADAYKILGNAFQTKGNFEKALEYYEKSYQLAEKIGYKKALPGILNNIGLVYLNQGNYPTALKKFYETLKAAENVDDKFVTGSTLNNIANVHFFQGKMEEAESDYIKMLKIAEETHDTVGIILGYNNIGEVNLEQNNAVKALHNLNIAHQLATLVNNPEMLVATTKTLGYVYYKLDSFTKGSAYFETALRLSRQQGNTKTSCKALIGLATVQNKSGMLQQALANGLEAVKLATEMGQKQLLRDANEIVASTYESLGNGIEALKHYRLFKIYSDSINNLAGERAAANYKAGYEFSKKELEFQRQTLQQRWLTFAAFAGLLCLCIIAWMINRNRSRLNHANKNLHQKNLLIEAQKTNAEETLSKLKAAQIQLIHSEKMASLGELTAGIAHEIQNPLNFVNNFSELSRELLDEMKTELDNGNTADAKNIANDVIQNLEKINQHGKRADAIVKGMQAHSRRGSGIKEETNINALVGEYVRLCHQGLKMKDKSFNAVIKTDFDKSIEKINIIPQDIGMAVLNLLNNAFYEVTEKKKGVNVLNVEESPYEPMVSVSTKKMTTPANAGIEIRIADNGKGISQKVLDKIFQPFFTTKPTGQGTGLGLSLCYDIVKAHGGELKVETEEGVGTAFIIQLPTV